LLRRVRKFLIRAGPQVLDSRRAAGLVSSGPHNGRRRTWQPVVFSRVVKDRHCTARNPGGRPAWY